MILRSILFGVALVLTMGPPAQAQKTKAQLNTEVSTTFPDNATGQITPSGVRAFQNDVINSIMPTAPVGSGNFVCFDGTSGLLKDCGSSPISQFVSNTNIVPGLSDTLMGTKDGSVVSDIPLVNCSVALTYDTATHTFGCSPGGTVFVSGTPTANQIARWVNSAQIEGVNFGTLQLTSASLSAGPSNPGGTSNAAGVMMGLGASCKVTPATSGRVRFTVKGNVTNNNSSKNTTIQGRYGTGTAPSNAAALTGSAFDAAIVVTTTAASSPLSFFTADGTVTGLSVGVQAWFDVSVAPNDGATTSSISNLTCIAQEF